MVKNLTLIKNVKLLICFVFLTFLSFYNIVFASNNDICKLDFVNDINEDEYKVCGYKDALGIEIEMIYIYKNNYFSIETKVGKNGNGDIDWNGLKEYYKNRFIKNGGKCPEICAYYSPSDVAPPFGRVNFNKCGLSTSPKQATLICQNGNLNPNVMDISDSDSSISQTIPLEFCEDYHVLKVFQILGYVLMALKIMVPMVLIVLGMIDLSKAVISNDNKANKEAMQTLIRRIILGVAIFFLPTVISFVLQLVDGFSETKLKFTKCTSCLFNPTDNNECNIPDDYMGIDAEK